VSDSEADGFEREKSQRLNEVKVIVFPWFKSHPHRICDEQYVRSNAETGI